MKSINLTLACVLMVAVGCARPAWKSNSSVKANAIKAFSHDKNQCPKDVEGTYASKTQTIRISKNAEGDLMISDSEKDYAVNGQKAEGLAFASVTLSCQDSKIVKEVSAQQYFSRVEITKVDGGLRFTTVDSTEVAKGTSEEMAKVVTPEIHAAANGFQTVY